MPYPDLHGSESQEGDTECKNMRCVLQQAKNSPQTILVLKPHDGMHVFLTSLCAFRIAPAEDGLNQPVHLKWI